MYKCETEIQYFCSLGVSVGGGGGGYYGDHYYQPAPVYYQPVYRPPRRNRPKVTFSVNIGK